MWEWDNRIVVIEKQIGTKKYLREYFLMGVSFLNYVNGFQLINAQSIYTTNLKYTQAVGVSQDTFSEIFNFFAFQNIYSHFYPNRETISNN